MEWRDFFENFVVVVISVVGSSGVILFIIQKWILNQFNKNLETYRTDQKERLQEHKSNLDEKLSSHKSNLDEKLSSHKSNLDEKLESHKAEMSVYSGSLMSLYEKQSNAIIEVYQKISTFNFELQLGSEQLAIDIQQGKFQEMFPAFINNISNLFIDLTHCCTKNSIFFEKDIEALLIDNVRSMRSYLDISIHNLTSPSLDIEKRYKMKGHFDTAFSKFMMLENELKEEFRRILRVVKKEANNE